MKCFYCKIRFCRQFKCRKELILFCIFQLSTPIRNEYQASTFLGRMINSWSWSWVAHLRHQLVNFHHVMCHAEQQWYLELILAPLRGLAYKSHDVVERVIIIWTTFKLNTSLSHFCTSDQYFQLVKFVARIKPLNMVFW